MSNSRLTLWLSCLIVAIFYGYEMMQLTLINSISTELTAIFQLSSVELSLLASAYLYSCAAFTLPAGLLLDRFNIKPLLLTTLGLAIIGTFIIAATHQYWLALIARVFIGIGNVFAFIGFMKLVSAYFVDERQALVKSLIYPVGMLGCIASQTPFALLMRRIGFHAALNVIAWIGIGLFLAIIFFVKPTAKNTQSSNPTSQEKKLGESIRLAVNKRNILYGLYGCIANLPIILLGTLWGQIYLMQVHGLTDIDSSQVTSLIFWGVMLGAPLIGWLIRFFNNINYLIIITAVVGAVILSILAYSTSNITLLALVFFALGIITSSQLLSIIAVSNTSPKAIEATSIGIVSIMINIGGAFYQLVFSYLISFLKPSNCISIQCLYTSSAFKYIFIIVALQLVLTIIPIAYMKNKRANN